VPTGQDTVAIAAAGSYTVTIEGAAAAMAITLKAGEATLQDNGDLTLGGALNVAAGTFVLGDGGSVSGGTIIGGKAGSVQLDAGTLETATLAGTIALDGYVTVSNGLILDKAVLNTSSGFLTTSDQVFMLDDGTMNIEAGSGSYGGGIESYSSGGSVILGPHVTVNEYTDGDIFAQGYLANYGTLNAISAIEYSLLDSATVFNAGRISANRASATQWLVASTLLQNNGLITASNGGSILVEGEGDATVANDGTIVVDSEANITLTGANVDSTGALKIAGGTLTVPASNEDNTTVFDDSGATYITGGSLVLQAATQLGGKFAISPGGVLLVESATAGGTISSRGSVEITSAGTLTNTEISGGTLIGEVDGQENSGDLSNITLNDTTVQIASVGVDGFLYFTTTSALNNVTFDIGTSNAQQVRFEDAETISNGKINLNGNGALVSTSSLTLTGKLSVVVIGTENVLQATYFTDAVNIAVSGAGNALEFLGYQITQDATLAASQGGAVLVQGHNLTNNGAFAASSGGSIEFVSTSLSNEGLVLADDGLVYVDPGSVDDFSNDGTFSATNGGTVELGNNERNGQPGGGGTITNLAGGVLTGGTWLVSGASQLDLSDNARRLSGT
jgi:hypothetical protein